MPVKNTQMRKMWHRIESWLSRLAPDILAGLHKGARARELRCVEQQLGVRFPVSVRECYRIHNGAEGHALLGYWEFLSLDQMQENWNRLKRCYDEGVFRASRFPKNAFIVAALQPVPILLHLIEREKLPVSQECMAFCPIMDSVTFADTYRKTHSKLLFDAAQFSRARSLVQASENVGSEPRQPGFNAMPHFSHLGVFDRHNCQAAERQVELPPP